MATRLPDRVIDVSEDPIKLYQTTDEHEPCTCLSHCWGKTKAECATSKDNLASQMIGIRWESLPQTFKDAILFNRGLGIRYIWIDSVVSLILVLESRDSEFKGLLVYCTR